MAGFKVTLQIDRLGEGVPLPEAIFGHFGQFTGDVGGELEIEIDDWGVGLTVIVPLQIMDPRDGVSVTVTPVLTDGEILTVDMSHHGRYIDPSEFTPPEP